jgi:hypothetical protein
MIPIVAGEGDGCGKVLACARDYKIEEYNRLTDEQIATINSLTIRDY